MSEIKNPTPSTIVGGDDDIMAWAYSVEEYGPHVSLDKPEASPKVTDLVPLYARSKAGSRMPTRWRVFEDITHGLWGIEEDIRDGITILFPKKINREPLDGIVRAHNAALSATATEGE